MAEIIRLNKMHPLYQEDLKNVLSTNDLRVLRGKSIMITGASGLIGVCLIDALMFFNKQGAGITIYAVGRSKNKAASRLGEYYNDSHFQFIEQDVRQALPADIKPDVIIPLASNTHPLAYSLYPIETIEINVKGIENALQKAAECGAILLYPSTVEVYGNARNEDVFTEDYTGNLNLANARSCYPESKRVSEALCYSYMVERGVTVKIVRLSRIFGPTMLLSDTKASSQFILKALRGEDIVLKSNGNQFFSYTYVADAVAAMLYVLIHGENGVAYNIANNESNIHLKDFALACADVSGTQVVFDLPSEIETRGYSIASKAVLSTERLSSLGFQPRYNYKDAISRTIRILKSQ